VKIRSLEEAQIFAHLPQFFRQADGTCSKSVVGVKDDCSFNLKCKFLVSTVSISPMRYIGVLWGVNPLTRTKVGGVLLAPWTAEGGPKK
jgi:hypothetical protein